MTREQEQAKQLLEQIVEVLSVDHGIDSADLMNFPKAAKFTWPELTIDMGEKLPFDGRYVAFDSFEGDAADILNDHSPGDIRIYCMPTPELRAALPFIRIKMSRNNPSGSRFLLTEKGFVDEIASEWAGIAARIEENNASADDVEEDGTQCEACKHFTVVSEEADEDDDDKQDPPPTFCGHCGERLPVKAEVMS
jgi:hypothetical protein